MVSAGRGAPLPSADDRPGDLDIGQDRWVSAANTSHGAAKEHGGMASIPDDCHDLFEKQTFAHVATLTAAGLPHVTPVWIDYDEADDRLLINTERGRQKERNVRNNPASASA